MASDAKSIETGIAAQPAPYRDHVIPPSAATEHRAAQIAESPRKTGGRKRKRASEVADFQRREIPPALLRRRNLEAVSEDYGVAKIEALAEAVYFLSDLIMRRPPQPDGSERARGFAVTMLRRSA